MEPAVHTLIIESDGSEHRLLLNGELLSVHATAERAEFAAFLAARELNRLVKKLDFETDELGNLIALVHADE